METAATQQPESTTSLYPFDQPTIDIQINIRPTAEKPKWVTHRLRKPAESELIEWEKSATYVTREVSKREDEISVDDEEANARLWSKIVHSVKGYDLDGEKDADGFQVLTEEQKKLMQATHKVAAVRGLYRFDVEIDYGTETDDDAPVKLGGEQWRVKQTIGEKWIITHILREPEEKERLKFKRNARTTTFLRGARKSQATTRTNLRTYVELYDLLVIDIEGGAVKQMTMRDVGKPNFVKQIDSIFKHRVVACLMDALDAELQD